ncbi:MAG: tetratricopeptide repeat protein [Planctomycetales bacterium]|nr:tetratricopeptide repeat protein [Planctomycetales bacterium]
MSTSETDAGGLPASSGARGPTMGQAHSEFQLGINIDDAGNVGLVGASPPTGSAAPPTENLRQASELLESGHPDETHRRCLRLLREFPLWTECWNLLGVALYQLGRPQSAFEAFSQSLQIDASQAPVVSHLGVIALESGDLPVAEDLLRHAVQLDDRFAPAQCNLGNVLWRLRRLDEARACYETAISRQRSWAEPHSNLGALLLELRELRLAERALREAIRLEPERPSARINLGALLNQEQRFSESLAVCRAALQRAPDSAEALTNLGVALEGSGDSAAALDVFRKAMGRDASLAGNYLFALAHTHDVTDADIHDAHRIWGARVEAKTRPHFGDAAATARPNSKDRSRPLRIAYVSPDFRRHVVARYLLPILQHHDPNAVTVFGYSEQPDADEVTAACEASCADWRVTCGASDEAVAQQILVDEIDILIDLAGHTRGNRLGVFAHKPAPIQVSWLGYPYTTGLSRIDYYLTNNFLNPPESQQHHTERLHYLPQATCCWQPESDLAPSPTPAAQAGFVTFGALQRPNKITAPTLDMWTRLLERVRNSRLVLYFPTLGGPAGERLQAELESRGLHPDRFELRHEPRAGRETYLGEYHDIDIALDVTPWTGGTTIRDACWMGVTPVAWCGDRRCSRGSADALRQLNLEHLIANSADEYIEIASWLATDLDQLIEHRSCLRGRVQKAMCDAETVARQLERAYRDMWEQT